MRAALCGIGRETAQGLAQSGAIALLVARDRGRGAEVAAEIQSTRAAAGDPQLAGGFSQLLHAHPGQRHSLGRPTGRTRLQRGRRIQPDQLFNVLFTHELARRLTGTSVAANALHPGWPLKTNLGRGQTGAGAVFDRASKLIGSSAAKGARASLYLAGSPDLDTVTGQYFPRCRPAKSSALSHNTAAAERLWARSVKLCGLVAS